MASGPAALSSEPGNDSMPTGMPEKSRNFGQAAAILIECLPSREPMSRFARFDRLRVQRFQKLLQKPGADFPPGNSRLVVPPMSEVTRILSAIEQGDLHSAEQLLPLVYDELRKLAAQRLA